MARLKISSSLEYFKILKFFKIWALRGLKTPKKIKEAKSSGIVQKLFSEKASAITRTLQECVRNSSKMRRNWSCFIGKRGAFQNASNMRGTSLRENTFWTIRKVGQKWAFWKSGKSVKNRSNFVFFVLINLRLTYF